MEFFINQKSAKSNAGFLFRFRFIERDDEETNESKLIEVF